MDPEIDDGWSCTKRVCDVCAVRGSVLRVQCREREVHEKRWVGEDLVILCIVLVYSGSCQLVAVERTAKAFPPSILAPSFEAFHTTAGRNPAEKEQQAPLKNDIVAWVER
jgi:hypothetical protein